MKINKKGFTLIELLVTIVIVGLVVGLTTFGIISVVNNSKEKSVLLSENSLKEAARIYSSEMGEDSWKATNKEYDAFCVTIGELMNKGLLNSNGVIADKNIDRNTFVIVKRNNVTLSITNEEIISSNNDNYGENREICTGDISVDGEKVNSPKITNSSSFTDKIVVNFEYGSVTKDDGTKETISTGYSCLYGKSSSNLNLEGLVNENKCILERLEKNTTYYLLLLMKTEKGSVVSVNGEFTTSDFISPSFVQDANSVEIEYHDENTLSSSYYFTSTISGTSNSDVKKCAIDRNGIFVCEEGDIRNIQENTWYKTSSKNIVIAYPEESNTFDITARIYDGSNNYSESKENFIINKYNIKFYKNNAYSVDGNTGEYVVKSCISSGSNGCEIESPTIVATEGYSVVGYNTDRNAIVSVWNHETKKEVNEDKTYYAITKVMDASAPNVNITSTNNLKSTSQTATLKCSDNVDVVGYYWGTDSNGGNYTTSSYDLRRLKGLGLTKTISNSETYYLFCKDSAGNVNSASKTYYKYTVNNLIENINGTTGKYNNLNYSSINSLSYIVLSGTTLTLSNIYSIPNGASLDTFRGYSSSYSRNVSTLIKNNPVVANNATYYMWFDRLTYTLTLDKDTGICSISGAGTYKYGSTPSIGATACSGYNFDSWSVNSGSSPNNSSSSNTSVNISADTKLTANATPISYTISYTLNGGSVSGNPTTYNIESSITLKNPTKQGYTFKGWTGSNGTSPSTNVTISKGSTGNKSYTANWEEDITEANYVVKHWQQNIDAEATQNSTNYALYETDNLTGTIGTNVSPSVKTYTGFNSPNVQTVSVLADGSRVVNYYYTRKSYTVSLSKGTGISSVTGNGTYHYGKSVTIDATVSSGYTWSKWSGTHSTTTKSYTFNIPASNVSDTANATPISYTISYNLNGGSVSGNPTTYNIESSITLKNPTKSGYTFKGWTGSNGNSPSTNVTISKGSTGNKSYTANWEIGAVAINSNKFACEATDRLAIYYVVSCTGSNCIYNTKNGLNSSYDFSLDTTGTPSWSIDKSNYVDELSSLNSNCSTKTWYVNNTMNCRSSATINSDNVLDNVVYKCNTLNLYRTTMKIYANASHNWFYYPEGGCYLYGEYLQSASVPEGCGSSCKTTSSTCDAYCKCVLGNSYYSNNEYAQIETGCSCCLPSVGSDVDRCIRL